MEKRKQMNIKITKTLRRRIQEVVEADSLTTTAYVIGCILNDMKIRDSRGENGSYQDKV